MSNLPLYWSAHSLGDVVRRVGAARAEVSEQRLLGRDHLGVADELDRPVGQVLREVVALLGGIGLLDRSGCRGPGPGTTGWSRRPGSRSSARSRGRAASCASTPPCWSRRRAQVPLADACRCCSPARSAPPAIVAVSNGMCPFESGKPVVYSAMHAMPIAGGGCARSAAPPGSASRARWCGTGCSAGPCRRGVSGWASRSGRRNSPTRRSRCRPKRRKARSAPPRAPWAGRTGPSPGSSCGCRRRSSP